MLEAYDTLKAERHLTGFRITALKAYIFVYSCRVWITLNKLFYAPLQYLKTNPVIHLPE